jgi:hypothetical protein
MNMDYRLNEYVCRLNESAFATVASQKKSILFFKLVENGGNPEPGCCLCSGTTLQEKSKGEKR